MSLEYARTSQVFVAGFAEKIWHRMNISFMRGKVCQKVKLLVTLVTGVSNVPIVRDPIIKLLNISPNSVVLINVLLFTLFRL